jgi:hypothetical protein
MKTGEKRASHRRKMGLWAKTSSFGRIFALPLKLAASGHKALAAFAVSSTPALFVLTEASWVAV